MSKKALNEAFASKENIEMVSWKPNAQDIIVGEIVGLGLNAKYETPFLKLKTEKDETITVFVKTGMVFAFKNENWLDENKVWNFDQAIKSQIIAIRFDGQEKNERTGRLFQKFTVLFERELPDSVLKRFKKKD